MSVSLILGPRPGKKSKDTIKAQGVTDILTLLSTREQAESVKFKRHFISHLVVISIIQNVAQSCIERMNII